MKNLWYVFAAYSIIWTALWGYTIRLSRKNKELQEELHELQARVERVLTK